MEERNRQNTESIRDIVVKIESKEIVLPEFQRDFVWDISKTHDLFDSEKTLWIIMRYIYERIRTSKCYE
jgi:hypothetical protein